MAEFSARVAPEDAAIFAAEVLGTLEAMGKGEIPAEVLDRSRLSLARWLSGPLERDMSLAMWIGTLAVSGRSIPKRLALRDAMLQAGLGEVQQATLAHLRREEVRVAASGNVAGAHAGLEALGLGPVTVRRAGGSGSKSGSKSGKKQR